MVCKNWAKFWPFLPLAANITLLPMHRLGEKYFQATNVIT